MMCLDTKKEYSDNLSVVVVQELHECDSNR